jgi:hypothetical protein
MIFPCMGRQTQADVDVYGLRMARSAARFASRLHIGAFFVVPQMFEGKRNLDICALSGFRGVSCGRILYQSKGFERQMRSAVSFSYPREEKLAISRDCPHGALK